ncbi:Aste57867_17060 [Aphanomyces stellatus]|uniref:Aste57867_17060 protein n=1 Tax=Aphanomyces stellatus TaxID=120398 RepID=A0A485L8E8_9STRA|nr:hypothetical protein As57867_017002 [Aphanomyces stellatus]VFT93821.1 Aste57867_17060 [Aphanomyces stellatus]
MLRTSFLLAVWYVLGEAADILSWEAAAAMSSGGIGRVRYSVGGFDPSSSHPKSESMLDQLMLNTRPLGQRENTPPCTYVPPSSPASIYGDRITTGTLMGPPQGIKFSVAPDVQLEPFQRHDIFEKRTCGSLVSAFKEYKDDKCTEVLQESPPSNHDDTIGSNNGFVLGVLRAYSNHHNLVLRPDDVWLAIMVQFGLYVNGHAESLRSTLVKHTDGKEKLEVKSGGSLRTVEFGHLLEQFVGLMEEHLVDPSLGDWILPDFTTTTDHDRIVGSVVMMASLKAYFEFLLILGCGIPEVTLLGSVRDWENVRARVDGLLPFGPEMKTWVDLLVPVLDQFVAAANGNVDRDFWRQICSSYAEGSGSQFLSGWITVFTVFKRSGSWQGSDRLMRKSNTNAFRYDAQGKPIFPKDEMSAYPVIQVDAVAPGYLTVDLQIDDNGALHDALLFAGHTSFDVVSSDTVAPQLAWALALKGRTS